jgi:hypothetical protein
MLDPDRNSIETFVRDALGCRCPAGVFDRIECTENGTPEQETPFRWRLVIGNRLLIYLLPLPEFSATTPWIRRMMCRGREDRDTLGLNRFRAVVITPVPVPPPDSLLKDLGLDDRMHLHVIAPAGLPDRWTSPV